MRFISLAAVVLAALSLIGDEVPGADVFRTKGCPACHGKDGSGDTPAGKSLKAADLRSEAVQKKSDDELIGDVTNGRGKMPSFKSALTPEQIRAVVGYVRTLAKK